MLKFLLLLQAHRCQGQDKDAAQHLVNKFSALENWNFSSSINHIFCIIGILNIFTQIVSIFTFSIIPFHLKKESLIVHDY